MCGNYLQATISIIYSGGGLVRNWIVRWHETYSAFIKTTQGTPGHHSSLKIGDEGPFLVYSRILASVLK